MSIMKQINVASVINWRRHFHMYPEVAFKEYESSRYIAEELAKFPGVEVLRPTETSVVGVLKGGKPGKVVGLRADFDALPIQEEVDIPFKSKNPGMMHACGHDFHVAMLLGAVDVLHKMKDELSGTIKFIFQHAEEVDPGGASQIIATGVLDDVQAFYGAHVSADDPVGTVAAAAGPVYANADFFSVKIQGKGAHAARPDQGIDTILVGTEVVQALNFIVSRNIRSADRAVLTIGVFQAGTAENIIPDTAYLAGTVRTYLPEVRDLMESKINQVTKGVCDAYGAGGSVSYERGYAAVVNDEGLYKLFTEMTPEVLPDVNLKVMEPIMGGEDFSAYGNIAPALFVGIGAKVNGEEKYGHHHPKVQFNEEALPIGTALYIAFALEASKL